MLTTTAQQDAADWYLAQWRRLLDEMERAAGSRRPWLADQCEAASVVAHKAAVGELRNRVPAGLGEFGPHRLP